MLSIMIFKALYCVFISFIAFTVFYTASHLFSEIPEQCHFIL